MIRILLDTNIILDIALQRSTFYKDAENILKKIDEKKVHAYISASSITDIFYLLRKGSNKERALEFLNKLLRIIDVAGVNKNIIIEAMSLGWEDFEDAVQNCTAQQNDIEYLITRNTKDYKNSRLKILLPSDFLMQLK